MRRPVILWLPLLLIWLLISGAARGRCQAPPRFLAAWPAPPHPWYFNEPRSIAAGPDGYLYVTDYLNDRVQKLSPDGALITRWGGEGTGPGRFRQPYGVAVDWEGRVYVTDSENGRVQVFDGTGGFLLEWRGASSGEFGFQEPAGIAVGRLGDVYVTDLRQNVVARFFRDGRFIRAWDARGSAWGPLGRPTGIALDDGGNVYVADSGNDLIRRFDREGAEISAWGGAGRGEGRFDAPDDVAVAEDGTIFVSDRGNARVQRFNARGEFMGQWSGAAEGEPLLSPQGLAAVGSSLFVVDAEADAIRRFSMDGLPMARFGRGAGPEWLDNPDDIAPAPDGAYLVADSGHHLIKRFDADGNLLEAWGGQGEAPGRFNRPARLAVDARGHVYVSDAGNHRVQKLSADGQSLAVWEDSGGGGDFRPAGIAVDGDGFVYVVDKLNNRINKFDADGLIEDRFTGPADDPFLQPDGIAVDADGVMLVADRGNHCVKILGPDGALIRRIGNTAIGGEPGFQLPTAVAIGPDGRIYVSDTGHHRIVVVERDGRFVAAWGGNGSGEGRFAYPGGICFGPDGRIFAADNGNSRIQVFGPAAAPAVDFKAILVAGGGHEGDRLWDVTSGAANFAWWTLRRNGVSKTAIRYFSRDAGLDLDGNGLADDMAGPATAAALEQAICQWAADARFLLLYLVDHGGKTAFRLTGDAFLGPGALAEWLNQFQASPGMERELVVIVDACRAEGFVRSLGPPDDRGRILIAGASEDENAYFLSQGGVSFSGLFWPEIYAGRSIGTAFERASEGLAFLAGLQTPRMYLSGGMEPDHDCLKDGLSCEPAPSGQGEGPQIEVDSKQMSIGGGDTAEITVSRVWDPDGVARVWAVILPPEMAPVAPDITILDGPTVELMPLGEGRYGAAHGGFTASGLYRAVIHARDRLGNMARPVVFDIDVENPLRDYAVILVGAGAGAGPAIIPAAEMAVEALMARGLRRADIRVLGPPELTGADGTPELTGADGPPDLMALEKMLSSANLPNIRSLTVFMAGDGDAAGIALDAGTHLPYQTLGAWLDTLQNASSSEQAIPCHVIIEADYAGAAIAALTPPPGAVRLLIAGAPDDAPARISPEAGLSFSAIFWKAILTGADPEAAYRGASRSLFPETREETRRGPMLDANGNGIANEPEDRYLCGKIRIGRGMRRVGNLPLSPETTSDIDLHGDNAAELWVAVPKGAAVPEAVWAVITGPERLAPYHPAPAASLPTLELVADADGRFHANYGGFHRFGPYRVSFEARFSGETTSLSPTVSVFQWSGPDLYEPDNAREQAVPVLIDAQEPMIQNLLDSADIDWRVFPAVAGADYAFRGQILGKDGGAVDLEILNEQGQSILDPRRIDGDDPFVHEWNCPGTGRYFIKISSASNARQGTPIAYALEIFRPITPFAGYMKGRITDRADQPVSNAMVILADTHETDIHGTDIHETGTHGTDIHAETDTDVVVAALSRTDGHYTLIHEPGRWRVTVKAADYLTYRHPSLISIAEGGVTSANFILDPRGDDPTLPDPNPQDGEADFSAGKAGGMGCFISGAAR